MKRFYKKTIVLMSCMLMLTSCQGARESKVTNQETSVIIDQETVAETSVENQTNTTSQESEGSSADTKALENTETSVSDTANATDNANTNETTDSSKTTETPENPYEMKIANATIWTKEFNSPDHSVQGIENVRTVGLLTGDGSENKTRSRFRVGGTDLGIPVIHKDKLYLWFGDTFWGNSKGKPMEGGLWRSNVLAVSEDKEFSDGLTIDDMIGKQHEKYKLATELLSSKKVPGVEHTVIPTGSVSVNGKLYVYFMSVKEWGDPGKWTINYGGLAVSEDDGQTFKKIESFQMNPDRFGQISAKVVGEYVYGIGIGGGRYGDAYLTRVKLEDVEDMTKYEYFSGLQDNEPLFSAQVEEAKTIIDKMVGEPSFMFNEYLGEWVVTYLDEPNHAIVMRTAKELWGTYSDKLVIGSAGDFPAIYGGFVDEYLTKDNGKTFYYIMSMWDPVYNSILMEVTLK